MSDQIRVVIADDHAVVRKGLCAMIEEDKQISVVGEAGDGEAAFALIENLAPHVGVLDIDMPKLDGFGVVREMQKHKLEANIIFLTLHNDEDMLRAALELGAKGYLLKDSAMEEIVVGIRTVAGGQPYLSSAMTSRLLQRPKMPASTATNLLTANLTPTEQRILQFIAEGQSSKEIGAKLSIHYRTVENHRTNICRKLGIDGTNALVRFALQNRAAL